MSQEMTIDVYLALLKTWAEIRQKEIKNYLEEHNLKPRECIIFNIAGGEWIGGKTSDDKIKSLTKFSYFRKGHQLK